ncbi:hypothetical protein GQR58_015168 [Nymphon striatum]|nr:hypothetical protein GQR58_015168 [Nymphon striatum]
MNNTRAHFYRGRKKPPPLKKLPPTDENLQLHVLRAHLQMLLWKAADQRDPPIEARNIANFGWNIEGSTITPVVSTAPVAPQALLDVALLGWVGRYIYIRYMMLYFILLPPDGGILFTYILHISPFLHYRGANITFKQHLEDICDERQDQWANEVAVRLSGVIDLHASDAQYHVCCYNKFRVVPVSRPSMMAPVEDALRSVVTTMSENMVETWTTTELYSMYIAASGTVTKRQFLSSITDYFSDELLVLHIDGCENVVGFKSQPGDYNLSYYVRHKVIENTSATLLKLVSSLVSGGDITKPSLTLAQCIQQHICGAGRNQTTLGLAVKLHHKYGSSELIKTLNEHGITSTYDEVLRFRKSVAKFVLDNQSDYHKKLGLSTEIGPIFSWADNYDLYIASPNGMKSTHAMVMEFTQHPAGIINTRNIGVMQLTIPRLKKHDMSSVRFTHQSIQLEHYTGPSKVNPPLLPMKALSAEESQLQSASIMFSQKRDAAWLSQVHGNDKPVEWAGFNAQQDRLVASSAQKPKTLVVFGPMIDSPPAHPDTVITTLGYLARTVNSFGMQYTHLTVDLQLYQTACIIQWNDPLHWTSVILHPGMMHTLMSFLGCIGKLMKASWCGDSYQCSVCWNHQHCERKGLDQCSTGIPSHNCCVAAEFPLE